MSVEDKLVDASEKCVNVYEAVSTLDSGHKLTFDLVVHIDYSESRVIYLQHPTQNVMRRVDIPSGFLDLIGRVEGIIYMDGKEKPPVEDDVLANEIGLVLMELARLNQPYDC